MNDQARIKFLSQLINRSIEFMSDMVDSDPSFAAESIEVLKDMVLKLNDFTHMIEVDIENIEDGEDFERHRILNKLLKEKYI